MANLCAKIGRFVRAKRAMAPEIFPARTAPAFNTGFVGVIMILAYERMFVMEVFALFKYISQGNLQRLRLLTPSDMKPKPLAYS